MGRARTMAYVEKETLRSVYTDLIQYIDVHELLPSLFQSGLILNMDAKERIEKHGATRMDKAKCLLDKLLVSDNPNTFSLFLDALQDTNPNLASQLKRKLYEAKPLQFRKSSLSRQTALEVQHDSRGVSAIFENGIDHSKDPALPVEVQRKEGTLHAPGCVCDSGTSDQPHACCGMGRNDSVHCACACPHPYSLPLQHACIPTPGHVMSPHGNWPSQDSCQTTPRWNTCRVQHQCRVNWHQPHSCHNCNNGCNGALPGCCVSLQCPTNRSPAHCGVTVNSQGLCSSCARHIRGPPSLPSKQCSTKGCQCKPQDFEKERRINGCPHQHSEPLQRRAPCEHAERLSKSDTSEHTLCLTLHDYCPESNGKIEEATQKTPGYVPENNRPNREPSENSDPAADCQPRYHELLSTIVWATLEMSDAELTDSHETLSAEAEELEHTAGRRTDIAPAPKADSIAPLSTDNAPAPKAGSIAPLSTDNAPAPKAGSIAPLSTDNAPAPKAGSIAPLSTDNAPAPKAGSIAPLSTDTTPMKLHLKRSNATIHECVAEGKSSTLPARCHEEAIDSTLCLSQSVPVDDLGSSGEEDQNTSPGYMISQRRSFPGAKGPDKVGGRLVRKAAIKRKGKQQLTHF